MKCARVQFTIEMWVPFGYIRDGERHEWDDHAIEFDINENSCPNTHSLGRAFDNARAWHDGRSTCWGCGLTTEQQLLEIRDIKPGDLQNPPEGEWLTDEIVAFHAR